MDPENTKNPEPSGAVPNTRDIHQRFHHQIRQHGHALLAFVVDELQGPVPGIAITLERLELPALPGVEAPQASVNWVWMVGSADAATEQAVLHFFQTDAGKQALVWRGEGGNGEEFAFKLASTLLRLPAGGLTDPALPANHTVAPLNNEVKEATILTSTTPHPVCVPAQTSGWLQVAPRTEFSSVPAFSLQGPTAADTGLLGAWLVNPTASTVHGHVAAIVGARGLLVLMDWRDVGGMPL